MAEPGNSADQTLLFAPEFGLGTIPVTVSLWLVPHGARVEAGDRIVELLAGGATIDLEAPITGRLTAWLVEEDDPVTAGTALAAFEPEPREADMRATP